jgi:hypothetical protein
MAYHNLALAYGQMREFDEAIAFARRGLKIAPRDAALQRLDFRLRVLRVRELFVRAVRQIIRPRRARVEQVRP